MTRSSRVRYSRTSSSSDNLFPSSSSPSSPPTTIRSSTMGCCNLGCLGAFWVLMSFIATGLSCVGFYFPYWLEGTMRNSTPTYLGLWRRCNYLRAEDNAIEVVFECGHYSTFLDIPTLWWQIGTITIGTGCGLLLLVFFLASFGSCCVDVVSRRTARIAAHIQLLAGILLGSGLALYPLGWKSTEVRLVCGPHAGIYDHGDCTFLWAFWTAIAGSGTAILCSLIGCQVSPKYEPVKLRQTHRTRDDYVQIAVTES